MNPLVLEYQPFAQVGGGFGARTDRRPSRVHRVAQAAFLEEALDIGYVGGDGGGGCAYLGVGKSESVCFLRKCDSEWVRDLVGIKVRTGMRQKSATQASGVERSEGEGVGGAMACKLSQGRLRDGL